MPLLAYIAGKPAHFTAKEHNFLAGQTVQKQIIVINDSRAAAACDCSWSLALPQPLSGGQALRIPPGRQERIPLSFVLPANLKPGSYEITLAARFGTGETQNDSFTIDVLAPSETIQADRQNRRVRSQGRNGQTARANGLRFDPVAADADLGGYAVLIVGKAALTVDGPAPDISAVRNGLKVILFEQTADVLEKRFGFRVEEYGLRQLFPRVPDHPLLTGLAAENLHDWSGAATILPPHLSGAQECRGLGQPSSGAASCSRGPIGPATGATWLPCSSRNPPAVISCRSWTAATASNSAR